MKETFCKQDIYFMERALFLAEKGKGNTSPNPMVGAVIVKDNKIIGEGYHQKYGEAHAEICALEDAKKRNETVEGATLYVTLEPCSHYGKTPPCADRIIKEKIKRVVISAFDPNPLVAKKGAEKLKKANILVTVGVLEKESRKLNEIFMKYIVTKEPFVLLKSAMSLDGKIATITGESQWISSEESREKVHQLRNNYSAVMVGIKTVLKDNPRLTCRLTKEPFIKQKNPIRIIVDSKLSIPLEAEVLKNQQQAKTLIVATDDAPKEKYKKLAYMGIEIITEKSKEGKVDLKALMKTLGKRGIDSILLEGGAALAYGALEAKIVDKVQFYIAPILLGGEKAKTAVEGTGVERLKEAWKIKNFYAYEVGKDICIEGYLEDR